jgi:trehalose 6-phosphate synthase
MVPPAMGQPDLVIVSNRGPLSFTRAADGELVTTHGAGGLASSIAPAVAGTGATWVASAISEADREAAAAGPVELDDLRIRSMVIEPGTYRQYYDVVANSTLWFLHHGLWDLPRRPRFDRHWREAWVAYRWVNESFARTVADEAPEGATVLVQDYHLSLVGAALAALRPDLGIVHFHHTPFCDPSGLRTLPDDVAAELMNGLLGARACGFHSRRWAANFEACAEAALGRSPRTFIAPAATDAADLADVARSAETKAHVRSLLDMAGGRKVIVRVDRIELSKNIVRGFLAFDDLLRTRPEWRERVMFMAFVYPSREALADYLAYRSEVEATAARVNETWGAPGWAPIVLDMSDDHPRSVAAMRMYDVLLVNPIRDGLNLVAKEGPLVNERDGVLVLSREAGAWDALRDHAITINPFDVVGTSDALHAALSMDDQARATTADVLRAAADHRRPADWLADQLAAARS